MTRSIVRIGVALAIALSTGGLVKALNAVLPDRPLTVSFDDQVCVAGSGWCADALGVYESDSQGKNRVAELTYYDFGDNGQGLGFRFYLSSASGRTITVKLGPWKAALPAGAWCEDLKDKDGKANGVCPGQPAFTPPDFSRNRITEVSAMTVFGYSPPNYDFNKPADCGIYATADGRCVSDFTLRFTVSRKEYRIRFAPNLWRKLTQIDDPARNTMPYGAVGVQQTAAGTWMITPLLQHPLVTDGNGVMYDEPCPAVLERNDVVKGRNNWVFGGCYDMLFELTLTVR